MGVLVLSERGGGGLDLSWWQLMRPNFVTAVVGVVFFEQLRTFGIQPHKAFYSRLSVLLSSKPATPTTAQKWMLQTRHGKKQQPGEPKSWPGAKTG